VEQGGAKMIKVEEGRERWSKVEQDIARYLEHDKATK